MRAALVAVRASLESGCLKVQLKVGGKPHLRLNMTMRPIANKYREGKLKRTLKRELTGRETAKKQTDGADVCRCDSAQQGTDPVIAERKSAVAGDSSSMGALCNDRIRSSKAVGLAGGGSRTLRRCEPCHRS